MTMTNQPERARRIADLWTRRPDMSEADVTAQVDAELEAEAAKRAEDDEWARGMTESFTAMTACNCCRAASAIGARDGLCNACRPVVAELVTERRRNELVNGRTRRELALAYVERVGKP